MARGGGAGYRGSFEGTDDVLKVAHGIKAALDDLGTLLGYTNGNAAATTWDQAIDMVRQGLSAMTIMGDWAKGYPRSGPQGRPRRRLRSDRHARHRRDGRVHDRHLRDAEGGPQRRRGARPAVGLFGSREGQDAFSLLKGSIPARQDAGLGPYDAASLRTLAEFKAVSHDHDRLIPATAILAPPEYLSAQSTGLSDYSGATQHLGDVRGNTSIVLHTLENRRDMLRTPPRR